MFDLVKLQNDINLIQTKDEFVKYLESYFTEIETYFTNLSIKDLEEIKFEIEDVLYDLFDKKLIDAENSPIIQALLLLVAEILEKSALIGTIKVIYPYLPNSSVKYRIEASMIYLSVNDIRQDFHNNFDRVMELFLKADKLEEQNPKTIVGVLNYLLAAYKAFARIKDEALANSFRQLFISKKSIFLFLQDKFIVEVLDTISISNYLEIQKYIQKKIDIFNNASTVCNIDNSNVFIEKSSYSKKLYALEHVDFSILRNVAYKHIAALGDPKEYHDRLNHGAAIINSENLLYKYLLSYGLMHKMKLYEAFKVIAPKIKSIKLNIVDWGCGQALATILLIEYIKEHNLNIDIDNIILVEPSKLALSRGLLHVDIFKQGKYKISAVNKDLDCIKREDIEFNNNNTVLHLFSNILDVESFKLDNVFLEKISKNIIIDNYFLCVSPNINAKRNGRLDIFYKYFDDNFDTEIISARDTNIGKYKRYERIFQVKQTKEENLLDARKKMEHYSMDVYAKLSIYASFIEPTLNTTKLKDNMETDPDYVIFKIRKTVEIITSKIFTNNEGKDESRVSQNDKIRYLSFEKKILTRKAQTLLHTIRTLGNIGAHEHIDNPEKLLKDDAYFLLTALTLLLEDFKENKLI